MHCSNSASIVMKSVNWLSDVLHNVESFLKLANISHHKLLKLHKAVAKPLSVLNLARACFIAYSYEFDFRKKN